MSTTYSAGIATAYGAAVRGGYTGTYQDYCAELAALGDVSAQAETLEPGSDATASYENGVFSFGIPEGEKGDTPSFSIGTVQTLGAGSPATATITGTDDAPVLNLGIPEGHDGDSDLIAPDFDNTKAYAVGDYVIHSGKLYRFLVAHAAGAWSDGDAEIVALGSDVSNQRKDIIQIFDLGANLLNGVSWEVGTINTETGKDSSSSLQLRTGYIPLDKVNTLSVKITSSYKYIVALINGSKTSVVNTAGFEITNKTYDLDDYPTAKYLRVALQKRDNTLPDSPSYISISFSSNLSEEIYGRVKIGEVSYHTLAQDLKDTLNVQYDVTPQTLTYAHTNSLLKRDGTIASYTGNYNVTDYIDCSSWFSIKFSGRQYYDGQCLAFYDASNTLISCFPDSASGVHDYSNEIINVPQTAKYIRIAQYGSVATVVYIATIYVPSHMGNKWKGKKWVCIGDSLTEVNSAATLRYHDFIANATGITVVNLGVGGTGYMNGGSGGSNPFRNRVSSIPLDADVITIFGSFNDLGDTRPLGTKSDSGTSTIGGCVNTTLDDIFARITLANIGIVTPTPWGNAIPLDNESSLQWTYVQLLKDICKMRGIPCLDLFSCSQLRPWDSTFKSAAYSNDPTGVHPDENGHKLIAPRFEGFLDSLLLV